MHKILGVVSLLVIASGPAFAAEPPSELPVWAARAVKQVMSFGYEEFEAKKEANKPLFTAPGHSSFYAAMAEAKIPQTMRRGKMRVTASVQCEPETTRNAEGGWSVRVPVALEYTAAAGVQKQYQDVTLVVVPGSQGQGYGIEQWVTKSISAGEFSVCGAAERKKARIGELRREIAQREAELKALEEEIKIVP